jgi:hypothetical protein
MLGEAYGSERLAGNEKFCQEKQMGADGDRATS